MKKLILMTAAVLALQAIPALAQDAAKPEGGKKPPMENPMFAEQDTDKNGSVSESEFLAFGKKKFDEIDADKNGEITKEEAKKHHESRREKWKEMREKMLGRPDGPKPGTEKDVD
jgi:hypothetical protein